MALFDFFKKKEEKKVPAVGVIGEETRSGIQKAYIPNFIYKPPFGYPRYVDIVNIRRLATMPFVSMCISAIIDEACAVEWDIIAKEGKEGPATETHIQEVKDFFDNPNTNKESFEEIRRKYIRDILEVDAGIINKVFNQAEEMVEIVARDGATFTKNPDIYGMFTDRDEFILESQILPANKEGSAMTVGPEYVSAADARERAAYFQYGWISGARPVPFGKREIVWMERNPRTDSIYGRSPIENLAETIQTLIYAIESNLEYFNDNNIPKGILALEGSNTEEINAFKDQWEAQQQKEDTYGNWKKQFHKIPIVGKKPEYVRFQLTNSELELLEGQKWWAKMVWACFGVTSVELGYTEDAKGLANQIVQSNIFKKRSLYPLLRLEEYRINQEIVSEFEFDDVEFKFILFDVEEETKKANLYKLWLDTKLKSINEIRVEEGMEEVEWGNEPEKQQNNFNFPFGQGSFEQEEGDKKKESEQKAELKYKYIRRTGSPGNYRYWYRDPKTGKVFAGRNPEDEEPSKYEEFVSKRDATWKATMTKAEADEWAKESDIQETPLHGTPKKFFAESIKENGINPDLSEDGFYTTTNDKEAKVFAKDDRTLKKGEILKFKINSKNFPEVTSDEMWKEGGYMDFAKKVKKEGIDGFYYKKAKGTVYVIYNKKSIVVIK